MSAYRMHLPQNSPAHPRRGLADWTELMLKDHGFLRLRWHNLHQIDSHMWRSNQPTPARIKQCATLGINTIINLRGERDDGGWRLEAEACHKAGLTLVDFTARSRAAPDLQDCAGQQAGFRHQTGASRSPCLLAGHQ